MEMTPIYSPRSDSEASVLTAMMQAYDIDFVMQGAAFSTMYPGPVTSGLNAQVLMVREDQVELARQLLATFIEESEQSDTDEN
ncbi:hypothetical protein [Pusillimonas sp.]|uniref:hypothetical protein n=1 Tax=Pusillimonas sp. TaxID=3040095 RepID=UPI0037C4FB36